MGCANRLIQDKDNQKSGKNQNETLTLRESQYNNNKLWATITDEKRSHYGATL